MTQNIGEGHFMDDTDEDESESEDLKSGTNINKTDEDKNSGDDENSMNQEIEEDDGGLYNFLENKNRASMQGKRGNVVTRRRGPRNN